MGQTMKIDNVLHNRQVGSKWKNTVQSMLRTILIEKGLLLLMIGFLLGRAVVLYEISPFALAFVATAWAMQQKRMLPLSVFVIFGALTYSVEQALFVTVLLVVFFIQARFLNDRTNLRFLIPFVFVSIAATRIFLFSLQGKVNLYDMLQLTAEGVLAIVLLLIFMQSIPLLTHKKYQPALKNEEVVCMIILVASVLTGFIGWDIAGVSLVQVFSRYIVLVFAIVGGAAIGSTVGVVAGLILSLASVVNLYQMSLLAFAGLLGGLLQEGKKISVSLGLLVGTFLVGIYGDVETIVPSLLASLSAVLLFFITPNKYLKKIAKFIPGTTEYSYEERKYLKKVRDVTAQRVGQYSTVFEALSKSFIQSADKSKDQNAQEETDYFLSLVTEKTCQLCFMKERCWEKNFDTTYHLMENLKNDLVTKHMVDYLHEQQFANHCVKSKKVIETMQNEVSLLQINKKLKKQVSESKKIVADQLKGVSDVMDNFANEIVQERAQHDQQELQIIRALKNMQIQIEKLDIYQLEKGNTDIEMALVFHEYHGEGAKLIAPVLTDILNETIIVTDEEISPFPNGVSFLTFGSAKRFEVSTGAASAAKGGGLVSGDAFTMMELGKGRFALAISDGMGNGIRAREESVETLRLLEQILKTGISEQVAIKSINSILGLRTTDEIFATLDLSMINLHNATLSCLKIGSSPSFIKRGRDIIPIEGSNLPIGIIEHVDLESNKEKLKSGDILIMISDGIYDGPKNVKNNELWLRRKIHQLKTEDPQEIADLLLEEVVREEFGAIRDDMTVVVAKVEKHQPKWSKIPQYDIGMNG